jgi:ornithine cyclodeaminase/alanine dehydrogenase-like protein (mu-crystallin family)
VIANQKAGRHDLDTVTVYKSLGLAVQDLVKIS